MWKVKAPREDLPVHRSPLASVAASLLRLNEDNSKRSELGLASIDGDGSSLPRAIALSSVPEAALSIGAPMHGGGASAGGASSALSFPPAAPGANEMSTAGGAPASAPGSSGDGDSIAGRALRKRAAAAREHSAADKVLAMALLMGADGMPGSNRAAIADAGGSGIARKPSRRPRSASAVVQIAEAAAAGAIPLPLLGMRSSFTVPVRLLYMDEAATRPRDGVSPPLQGALFASSYARALAVSPENTSKSALAGELHEALRFPPCICSIEG